MPQESWLLSYLILCNANTLSSLLMTIPDREAIEIHPIGNTENSGILPIPSIA